MSLPQRMPEGNDPLTLLTRLERDEPALYQRVDAYVTAELGWAEGDAKRAKPQLTVRCAGCGKRAGFATPTQGGLAVVCRVTTVDLYGTVSYRGRTIPRAPHVNQAVQRADLFTAANDGRVTVDDVARDAGDRGLLGTHAPSEWRMFATVLPWPDGCPKPSEVFMRCRCGVHPIDIADIAGRVPAPGAAPAVWKVTPG